MNDSNGVSTCKPGEEKYEKFHTPSFGGKNLLQYDYRDTDGQLFSCVASTLEMARAKKNAWLKANGKDAPTTRAQIFYTNASGPWFCNVDGNHLPDLAALMQDYHLMAEVDITEPGPLILPALESLFMKFNDPDANPLNTQEKQDLIRRTSLHTSMTTGDVIVIGHIAYLALLIGWKRIDLKEKAAEWKVVE